MRKNVKQQLALRVLSTAALMAMVSSIATAAFADTYDLNKGSVTVETKANGITYVTQKDDKQVDGFARNKNNEVLNEHPDDTGVTITSDGKQTSNTITVETAKDQTTDVTLDKVHIEVNTSEAKSGAIEIKGDGNTNLELNGDNTVLVKNNWSEEHAAIEKADKYGTGTLTITDDKNDDGTAKDKDENGNAAGGDTGKLVAGGYHDAAAIGGGGTDDTACTSNITITGGEITANGGTYGAGIGGGYFGDASNIRIEGNADVTAFGDSGAAIGTGYGHEGTSTVINITGGTVNAVTRDDSRPAIGTVYGNLDLTINSSTGKTTVNTYTTSSDPLSLNIGTGHYDDSAHKYRTSPSEGAEYNEDGSSHLGEDNAAIINFYRNTTLSTGTYDAPKTLDDYAFHATSEFQGTIYNAKYILSDKDKDKGDLYKVVHNRKYMEEDPNIDITKLEDEDLHDWQLVGKVVEPTLEKDGYADYICSIDKCGQTKHVVLPKLTPEPSEPDVPGGNTPDTPNKPDTPSTPDVPSTPEVTPADPAVTPDAPAQDGTAPADTLAADTTATAQNVVQDAKPEAAAAASTAAPAAATLPQTGANWLAVVGSALSGLFLLAAGFVLDRKNRRMN